MSQIKEPFTKPSLTLDEQADLLASRGLDIPDRHRLLHYLKFIGYYRLSGYCLFYQADDFHHFKTGTTFQDVLDLYIFDRELRLLVMDAIERIEVAVRSCISNTMSLHHGPHWFINESHFIQDDRFRHVELIAKIKRETGHPNSPTGNAKRREIFLEHYYSKYNEPALPPCWMVAEVMPIGTWSLVFSHLKDSAMKQEICEPFEIHYKVMTSWLHTVNYMRNLCAHHLRIWNRSFSITPIKMKKYKKYFSSSMSFYDQAVVLHILMSVIADGSRWQKRLADLFDKHASVPIQAMGFPADWQDDQFWRINR
ncbi:MAG: Abi family protein [Pseudomonadota bacterium]